MGFLSDLRKIIFGAKSVSKSAADKAIDYGVKTSEDALDKVQDVAEKTGSIIQEKTSGLRDAILEGGSEVVERAKDTIEDVAERISQNEGVQKAAEMAENVGDKILDAGEKTVETAGEFAEKVGSVVLDKGEDLTDKAKDMAERVGEKVLDAKDDIVERAKSVADSLSDKLDETIEKAEDMAAQEKAEKKSEFADTPIDTKDSLLDDSDDFFAKADRYASGDYGAFSEGETRILPDSDAKKESKPPAKAAGFEDLDGDGNEMVDDAIIVSEEE